MCRRGRDFEILENFTLKGGKMINITGSIIHDYKKSEIRNKQGHLSRNIRKPDLQFKEQNEKTRKFKK